MKVSLNHSHPFLLRGSPRKPGQYEKDIYEVGQRDKAGVPYLCNGKNNMHLYSMDAFLIYKDYAFNQQGQLKSTYVWKI